MQPTPHSVTVKPAASRNYGIDLLRIVSMFMVAILHVLWQGGVLDASVGAAHHVAWLLETSAYCAVNCYAMISGYVCYTDAEKPYRYSKYLSFWLPVFTYSFGITLLFKLIKPELVTEEQMLGSAFPIAFYAYWYASCYTGLFFVIPYLNRFLRSLTKGETNRMIALLLTVFVGYVTFARRFDDCFKLSEGYSFVWLVLLYLMGAWMKKCDIPSHVSSKKLILGSIAAIVFSWAVHEFVEKEEISRIFVDYTSATIVFVAFSFVCIFSKLRLCPLLTKLTRFFAPAAFGVYLIHVQNIVWDNYVLDAFIWIADKPAWLVPALVLGSAFCILTVCLLIEKLRLAAFQLLGINKLVSAIENRIDRLLEKVSSKFN